MLNTVSKDSGTQYSRSLYNGSLERTSSDYDVFHPRDPNKGHWKSDKVFLSRSILFQKIQAPNIQEPSMMASERTLSDYDVFNSRDPNKGH